MIQNILRWDDLELLRLLCQEAIASGAARYLGLDQTTVSRRLARMEQQFGTILFDRIDRRLVPTPTLLAALADLERMAEVAAVAVNAMHAAQSRLTGKVAISAVDPIASWVMAPRAAKLAQEHPGLTLELRAENRNVSLARREADIALRLGRPETDDALIRRLGTVAFCLAGPATAEDATRLPLAAYTEDLAQLPESRWIAAHLPDIQPSLRANTLRALIEATAGGFRALLPRFVVNGDDRLQEIPTAEDGPVRELWLLVHPVRRHDPAVVAVVSWIEAAVKEAISG